jgi:aminoglycoside/choline kinase family phosphotransferase
MKSQDELVAFVRTSLGLSANVKVELTPFEGRGSDRTYFRFRWSPKDSVIVVCYQPTRVENAYYPDIAMFLLENNIPVPQIFGHDAVGCFIVMKDLGDIDLWSLRDSSWETRENLYKKTLTIAHRLHSYPEHVFPSSRVRLMEAFGPDIYRWERNYFKDNFVGALCGVELEPGFEPQFEKELAALAERLSSDRRSLVHRDLQSQNVMIYQEEAFLIDFQGMRFGTRFYDLGSLLCDPYVSFSESERLDLLAFYYGLSEPEIDWDQFQNKFWEASAQRLMQALGAYGFLGITKGLKSYLAHIPAGLRNLRMAADNAVSLPKLRETCMECDKALRNSKLAIASLESQVSNLVN